MRSKNRLLKNWRIYPILDNTMFPDTETLVFKFSELIKSPVDAIQLRLKDPVNESFLRLAAVMAAKAAKKGISLIMNDRPELAIASGCDGVHLGKADMTVSAARKFLGRDAIIGCTVRGRKDLEGLKGADHDYVSIGPVFHSPLKSDIDNISYSEIRGLCRATDKTVVAIGGIDAKNVGKVLQCGVQAVAFMRYALADKDTEKKIKQLKRIMGSI